METSGQRTEISFCFLRVLGRKGSWSFFLMKITPGTGFSPHSNGSWSCVLMEITPGTGFSPHPNGSTDIQGVPGVTPRVTPPPQGLPGLTTSSPNYRKLQSSLSSSQPREMALWRLVSVFFYCCLFFILTIHYLPSRTTSEFKKKLYGVSYQHYFVSFL